MGKILRRTFLVSSAVIAGGVGFGYYTVKKPHDNPLEDGLADGEATFNPWVMVNSDGVTLITPHTDIGQGAYSMQAALIAEELDVEWGQFAVSPGIPDPAYFNSALASEGVPFLSSDQSFMANTMRGALGAVAKVMGIQGTGGSSSVPDSFEKLRRAGAVARETLKLAAAEKTGTPVDELSTAEGHVVLPDGGKIAYAELADIAADLDPVNDVELRDPSEWRLIGKPMQRLDIVAKSTGTQDYGIDLTFENMVYAAVRLNPRQGSGVKSYDASTAKAMRGVIKVVPITNGLAVVADNSWRAFQAANALEIEWEEARYPNEMADHWKILEDSFTEDAQDSRQRDDGDVEAALADGEVTEAEYRAPYLVHQPLEPLVAVAKVTADRVDVWTSSQMHRFHQANAAIIAGVEENQAFLHNQMSGGSFGHRLEDEQLKLAVEVAKTMKGKHVKLTYSREEDFIHDFPRQIAMSRARGTVKDGQVDTLDMDIAMPSPMGSQMPRQLTAPPLPGPDGQIVAGAWNQPYAIPNFRVTGYRAEGLAPISSWRAVGASSNGFFAESFLDELIHAAGADPLEERLRLAFDPRAKAVLEAVGEMSSWGSDLGPNRGRGIAMVESFAVPVAEVVEVTNTPDGITIDKVYVAAEVGTVVDPVNFENLMQGGVVFGLAHAMNCELTYSDGMAEQTNFHMFEGIKMYQVPEIEVRAVELADQVRGIGEPPVPPAAPALANAIFAATGQRLREMPFNKFVDFA